MHRSNTEQCISDSYNIRTIENRFLRTSQQRRRRRVRVVTIFDDFFSDREATTVNALRSRSYDLRWGGGRTLRRRRAATFRQMMLVM